MAVFQKNDPDQASQLEPYFDGELDEECNHYDECSAFAPYLAAGKPVLNAEYIEDGETTAQFCAADERLGMMGALYSINLDGSTYSPCFGASVLSGPITGGPFSGTGTTGGTTASSAAAPRPAPRPPVRTPTATVDRTPPHVTVTSQLTRPARRELRLSLRCAHTQSYCAGTLSVSSSARSAGHKRLALTSRRYPCWSRSRLTTAPATAPVRPDGSRFPRLPVIVAPRDGTSREPPYCRRLGERWGRGIGGSRRGDRRERQWCPGAGEHRVAGAAAQ
jgi:hypothetical protein